MAKRTQSDSSIQRGIEIQMLEKIKVLLKDDSLASTKIPLGADKKQYIHPDFYSDKNKIIGEIHAHIGRLKGSQPGKIAKDIMKMNLLETIKKCKYKKFIAVCDSEEYKQLTESESFLAMAIKAFDVKVLLIDNLKLSDMEKLKESMKRQNLLSENEEL